MDLGPGQPVPCGPIWGRCHYWLQQKRRFCRMAKVGSERFCGEHIIIVKGPKVLLADGEKRARMPCPYDPSHTCYEHLLKKHMSVCNARPKDNPSFISENLNRRLSTTDGEQFLKDSNSYKRLDDFSDEEYGNFIRKLVEFRQRVCPDIQNRYGFHELMGTHLLRTDIGESAMKHLSQVASLLNIMEMENMLQDNTCFIEYGSGTGALTFQIAQIVMEKKLENCSFVLIDKTSHRHKRDNKLNDSKTIDIHRIRADIKDVAIGELPGVSDEKTKRIVGVAKHLCGSATDMAIRSLFDCPVNNVREKVIGCCFATCCHHRCELEVFPGWKFLKDDFSSEIFRVLTHVTSWATNGDGKSRLDDRRLIDVENLRFFHNLGRSQLPNIFLREQIGEFAKEILEYGRIQYIGSLEKGKFNPGVANYIDRWTTKENRVIFASSISPTVSQRKSYEKKIFQER